ncbi:[NiFe]-hydrogenase assembly chaperone HybE [Thiohalorhabdus sp.]|uniref:[NiFe]-hydrogenase assembly chaperone HybE n=1 Tax=Thiohalorhabdus sp. TaxID=3094134 RepID=UPI002FC2907F
MSEPAEARWEFHNVPDPVAGLEAAYQGLLFDLMGMGNPRINNRLEVAGEGPETVGEWHRVILVTPWTAQRVYLPVTPSRPEALPDPADLECEDDGRVTPGVEVALLFGSETRDLEVAYDPRLGHHLTEELLANMGSLGDSQEALAWAREMARRLDGRAPFSARTAPPEPQRLSRRDLFRRLLNRG